MRIFLLVFVIVIGANIGLNAINSMSEMERTKQQQYCQIDPNFCDK